MTMARWKVSFSEMVLKEEDRKGVNQFWAKFGLAMRYTGQLIFAIKRLFFADGDFMQKYIEREMETRSRSRYKL